MRNIAIVAFLLLYAGLSFAAGSGDRAEKVFEKTSSYTASDGKTLYAQNCAGCHMPEGQGAKGAGMYPRLAKNSNVENPSYTGFVVMYGLRGMPSFEPDFTDEQIAAVANYVSEAFGNKGSSKVTAEDVKAVRPEKAVEYIDW